MMIKSGLNSIPRPKYVGAGAGPAPGSYATTILATSGLVAFWELGDAVGSSTVVDSGPNGINGSTNGTVTFGSSGQNGQTSATFTGSTNGHIGVPNNGTLVSLANFSIEGWALATGANNGVAIFTEIFASNAIRLSLSFDNNPTHAGTSNLPVCGFYNGGSGGWQSAFSASALTQNSWQYFVGTFDGTTLKVYTNASLAGSATATAALPASGHGGFVIGARTDNSVDFVGSLQYIAIYNVALSQATISAHFAAI